MPQAKFSITAAQEEFLTRHERYGFRDRSEVVRTALEHLRAEIEARELEESAALYAELYDGDAESREWVEDSIRKWPE